METNHWTDLEAFVEGFMQKEQIPGAAIAVAQHGQTIYEQGFGYRDISSKEPVMPDTIFGVASITKSMTALAMMKLNEAGKLDVNAPVIRYLPEFKLPGLENMGEIKIHHLLTHTTGLPPVKRREDITRFDDHLSYLANQQVDMLGAPGEYLSYCNDTFLLLGAIVERVTGESFEKYMTENILQPLQMDRSTLSLEKVMQFEDVTTPYVKDVKTGEVQEAPWPGLGNYKVGGGVRSCVRDLIKYGNMFVNQEADSDLNQMWHLHHAINDQVYYGYALEITKTNKGITFVKHGGAQAGVSAHFGFVPEKGLVVAILTNMAKVAVHKLWLATVNHVLGFSLDETHLSYDEEQITNESMEKILGVYGTDENGRCVISRANGQLQAEFETGETLSLRAINHRTLVVEGDRTPIQFYFKDEGENEEAWAFLHQRRMWRRVK